MLSCCLAVDISCQLRKKDWKEVAIPKVSGLTVWLSRALLCKGHCSSKEHDKDLVLRAVSHTAPQYPNSVILVWLSPNSNAEFVIEYNRKSEFALQTFIYRHS